MSKIYSRQFIYTIPESILFDTDLTDIDKKIYMIIRSFMDTTGKAYPPNGWLADKIKCDSRSITRGVDKLLKKKYIRLNPDSNGREFLLGSPVPASIVEPPKTDMNVQGVDMNVYQLDQSSITSKSNIEHGNVFSDREPEPSKAKTKKEAVNEKELFAKLWSMYPLKKDKLCATKALSKALRSKGAGKVENLATAITDALTAMLAQRQELLAAQKSNPKIFVSHPQLLSTWLNKRRWEDELEITEPEKPRAMPSPGAIISHNSGKKCHREALASLQSDGITEPDVLANGSILKANPNLIELIHDFEMKLAKRIMEMGGRLPEMID